MATRASFRRVGGALSPAPLAPRSCHPAVPNADTTILAPKPSSVQSSSGRPPPFPSLSLCNSPTRRHIAQAPCVCRRRRAPCGKEVALAHSVQVLLGPAPSVLKPCCLRYEYLTLTPALADTATTRQWLTWSSWTARLRRTPRPCPAASAPTSPTTQADCHQCTHTLPGSRTHSKQAQRARAPFECARMAQARGGLAQVRIVRRASTRCAS